MSKEVFPKVSAETTIKSCTKKKGCVAVQFNELNFTGSQFEQISDWIDDDVKLIVTIEQKQGNLYNTENQADESQQTADKELPKEEDIEYEIDESGIFINPSNININIPKNLRARCIVQFGRDEKCMTYHYGYYIEIGLLNKAQTCNTFDNEFNSLKNALEAASEDICNWIDKQKYSQKNQLKTKIIKTIEAYC